MNIVQQVRLLAKKSFDRIRNERLKRNLLQAIPFWAASLITGVLAVLYARLFALAESGTAYILIHKSWVLFFVTPLCFITAWWVVIKFSTYARGSGIPQVMASIELTSLTDEMKVSKFLSIRIIIIKMISSLTMALGGGAIGREGPTIQIAGSVFKKIYQWLPKWWPRISKLNMIMTGAAAGLAAAFNTPLGGIVFAVEELTKTHINQFKTSLFTAIIIAGLTAQALLGPYLYLGYPVVNNASGFIIFGVISVAIIAGVSASIISKFMLALLKWKSSFLFRYQHLLYITIAAMLMVTAAFFIDTRVLGSGKDLMTHALFTHDKYSAWYMPALRMGGSILSFSVGAAGGVFAPALSAGASIGSAISGWMHLSDSNANLLILSGMVGFLTGLTRTPFTSAILVVEMTDRHSVILHLMLASLVANLVSYLIDQHSFYDHLKGQYLGEINQDSTGFVRTENHQ